MSQTLQTMYYPDKILAEMLRVGRECVVTFPNFGHYKARLQLLFKGRMPVSEFCPTSGTTRRIFTFAHSTILKLCASN